MPFCAECADALRAVFGADGINAQLKAGNFYAREGGVELGKRAPEGVVPVIHQPVTIGRVKCDR
jgi:hypothetical protein